MYKKLISITLCLCVFLSSVLSVSADYQFINLDEVKSKGGICIDFGEKLEAQFDNGYTKKLNGNNFYDVFKQAVAELPDEAPLIKPFEVKGANYFYVAQDGDDKNPGTKDKPFKTLQRAFTLLKGLTAKEISEGTVIYLREGRYILDDTVTIDDTVFKAIENGGLFISGYPGEEVTFTASSILKGDKFKLVTQDNTDEKNYKRISPEGAGHIYYADYSDFNITEAPGFSDGENGGFPDVYFNGVKMPIARYPNASEDYPETIVDEGRVFDTKRNDYTASESVFVPHDKEVFNWADNGKIGVFGQFCVSWYIHKSRVKIDYKNQTLTAPPFGINNGLRPTGLKLSNIPSVQSHFYYYNVLEKLDMLGEWCADDITKRFYIYPPHDKMEESDEFKVMTRPLDEFFLLKNAKNVVFNNLTFDTNKGYFILTEHSQNVVVQNCKFRNNKQSCVTYRYSRKCGVTTSSFDNNNNCVGVVDYYEGFTDFKPSRNFVQNCHFNRFNNGVMLWYGTSGNVVSHNYFENFDADAVYIDCSPENIVEFNEMTAGVLQGNEGCMIYLGGAEPCYNNHIRYNYVHDARPKGNKRNSGPAIMRDDLGMYDFFYNNICDNMSGTIGAHSGDNQIYYGNILVNNNYALTNSDNYGNQPDLYGRTILNDPATGTMSDNYYKYCKGNEVFENRYGYITDYYNFAEDVSRIFNNGKNLTDDKVKFMLAATGTYSVNNILVKNLQSLDYGKLAVPYTVNVNSEQELSTVPQVDTADYNANYNNKVYAKYDYTKVDFFDKIGPLKDFNYTYNVVDDDIYIASPRDTSDVIEASTFDVNWRYRDDCNYYKVTAAYDEAFTDIAATANTNKNYYQLTIAGDECDLYYKVEGFSNNYYHYYDVVSSSPVYKVRFKPSSVKLNDGDISYGTPVIDGLMDDVYKKSKTFELGSAHLNKVIDTKTPNNTKLTFAWDNDYMYLYAMVNDTEVKSAGAEYMRDTSNPWQNDAVEVFINNKKIAIDAFARRIYCEAGVFSDEYMKSMQGETLIHFKNGDKISGKSYSDDTLVKDYVADGAVGYSVELKIPLINLSDTIENNTDVLIRVQNNDKVDDTTTLYAISPYGSNFTTSLKNGPEYVASYNRFDDISKNDWFVKYVEFATKLRYMSGTSEKTFEPNENVSLATLTAVIARLSKEYISTDGALNWYDPYMNWGKGANLYQNTDVDVNNPEKALNREQVALVVYNYLKYAKASIPEESIYEFNDNDQISESARLRCNLLSDISVMTGDENENFNPKSFITRAEFSVVLSNIYAFVNVTPESGQLSLTKN